MRFFFVSDMYQYSSRDSERFGLEYLESQGFRVHCWNLSAALESGKNLVTVPDRSAWEHSEVSLKTLKKLCRGLKRSDTLICVSLTQQPNPFARIRALRYLSRSKAFFTALSVNHLPKPRVWSAGTSKNLRAKIVNILISPSRLIGYLIRQFGATKLASFYLRVCGVRPLDAIWAGVSVKEKVMPGLIGRHTRIELIHSFDYDRAIEVIRSKPESRNSPFFVLLGGLGPLHPDSQNKTRPSNPGLGLDEWNDAIGEYIENLERLLDMKCLVALHPRTTDEHLQRIYRGRQVFRNRTAALCNAAEMVVTYDGTTSVSFPVLFRKPIITLVDDRIASRNELIAAKQTSDLLGTSKYQLGTQLDLSRTHRVNEHLYEQYEARYIKARGTPEGVTFWEHVAGVVRDRELLNY